MLYSHFSEKILGLQEAEIKNIEEKEEKIVIEIKLPQKECNH